MNSFGLQSCLASLIGAPGITGWFRPCRTHYRAKILVWDKTPAWNVFSIKIYYVCSLGLQHLVKPKNKTVDSAPYRVTNKRCQPVARSSKSPIWLWLWKRRLADSLSTLLGKDFKDKRNWTGLGELVLQAHTQQSDLTLQNPLCFKDNFSIGLANLCCTNRAERLQTGSAGIK